MAKAASLNTKPSGTPKRSGSPFPKRGAIPTPRAEIEKAKPYIPETDQAADQPTAKEGKTRA